MKRNWAGLLAALGFTVAGCQPPAKGGAGTAIHHADAAAARKLVAAGEVMVLDIRTPAEYAAGHIEGARLVDFRAADFRAELARLDRGQPYLVHCASGRRSTQALETFEALGFKEITHLDGGFNAWKAAGYPVQP